MSLLPQPLGQPWLSWSPNNHYMSNTTKINTSVQKFLSPIILTLTFLGMMVTAAFISGLLGFNLGTEALRGVRQPESSPRKKIVKQPSQNPSQQIKFISEREILVQVYNYIQSGEKTKIKKNTQLEPQTSKVESQEKESKSIAEAKKLESSTQSSLPIRTEDQGVSLEVADSQYQGGSLLLTVNLSNKSDKSIRFLYSFLDVRDDKNRALSAITEGLPGELPAQSDKFTGNIRIPAVLLESAETISLSLTDYPDQKLELKLTDIPLGRQTEKAF